MSVETKNSKGREKQIKARHLFVKKGLSQKETAAKVGITQKTMSGWVIKYGWMLPIHYRAKSLYLQLDITAKEVAVMINVTEKTLSSWVNKYGWKALKAQQNALQLGMPPPETIEVAVFKAYLSIAYKSLSKRYIEIIDDFLKTNK